MDSTNSFNNMRTDDVSAQVMQIDLSSGSNKVISSDGQREDYVRTSEVKPFSKSGQSSSVMSDFVEDFPYDQWEYLEEKNCYKKGSTKQLQKRKTHTTPTNTNNRAKEEYVDIDNHPALNMFDASTTEILKSIVVSNNYYTGQFGDIIAEGTNSVVIYAYISKKAYPTWHPGAKPILIYATINNEYNKRYRNWSSKQNAVKVYRLSQDAVKNERIFCQVQKEKEHLDILCKAKCNVPKVMRSSRNVIVTSLIGMDGEIAPSISTLATTPIQHTEEMYNAIVKDISMWYNTLQLIHGKLSCKNILFWNKEVYYIGWSHSVKRRHPLALKRLMRDCTFLTKFFEERSVPVKSAERLFKEITGLNEIGNTQDLWKSQNLTNPNKMLFQNSSNPGRNCRFK